ncbi:MAG: hypothetical protein QXP76_03625 [Acidilobaceae archaeon]
MNVISLEWLDGCTLVSVRGGTLLASFRNAQVSFSEREIEVTKLDVKTRLYERKDSNFLYLDLSEQLLGVKGVSSACKSYLDIVLGSYIVSHTKIEEIGLYITIQTSLNSLYDFAVITPHTIFVEMSSKRKVYFMPLNSSFKVFFV